MGPYRHLSREDRDEVAVPRVAGHSNVAIAGALDRSPSTISREVRRNALDTGRYSAQVTYYAFPESHWIKLSTNNPLDRGAFSAAQALRMLT